MVDKIIVNPSEVRGYGNILEVRERDEYERFHAEINDGESSVTIDSLEHTYFRMKLEGEPILVSFSISSTPAYGVQSTITANVVKESDDTPLSDLVMNFYVNNNLKGTGTSNASGNVTFTWTPNDLGDMALKFTVTSQDRYAEGNTTGTVTIGISIGISQLLTDVVFDSTEDEYVLTYSSVNSRTQLEDQFISDVYIAAGGEMLTLEDNTTIVANKGDVIIEYKNLDHNENSNRLYEEDIEMLTGSVKEVYQDTTNPHKFMKTRYDENINNFRGA